MNAKPNLLIILADDHGYGDISAHDGPHLQTPHIDRIAENGVRLTQFYANSSVCSPSRAALMAGRYPDRVGVPGVIRTHPENNWGYFDTNAVTLPDALHSAGYDTAHVGKWHLGLNPENHPCRRGFLRFKGFLGDMMDDYYTHLRHGNNYMRDNLETIDPNGHATDLFTDWAIEYIRSRQNSKQPFFLYLAYNAPHTPIQPPEEWVERVREREPEASEKRVRYAALVEHMDDRIGRVLDVLKETGLADNTLVVYTSDNGGQVNVGADNGPLRGGKGDMYEGGVRVPTCAMWPDAIPSGWVSDAPGMLIDLLPTFCDVAQAGIPDNIEGRSMLSALKGGAEDEPRQEFHYVRREGGGRFRGNCQRAVRQGSMKLLQNSPFEPLQMYDLSADPYETEDLAPSGGARFNELGKMFQVETQRAGGAAWQASVDR